MDVDIKVDRFLCNVRPLANPHYVHRGTKRPTYHDEWGVPYVRRWAWAYGGSRELFRGRWPLTFCWQTAPHTAYVK
jgi:hypothetical protein